MKKSELRQLIKEEILALTEEKKATRATIKSLMKKLSVPEDKYELSSDDVTIWFTDIGQKKAKWIMNKLQKSIPNSTITGNGSKYWLKYKGASLDMGDWNDASSRWHY